MDTPATSGSGWHLPLWLRGWLVWLLQLALFSPEAHSAAPTFQATAMPQCWQPAPFPPSPCNPAGRLGTFNCLQFLQQFSLASYTLLCFSNCQHPHILVLISLYNPLIGAPGPAGICGALDTSFLFDSCTQAPNGPPPSGSPSGTRRAGTLSEQSRTLVPCLQTPLPSTSTASAKAPAPSLSQPSEAPMEANTPKEAYIHLFNNPSLPPIPKCLLKAIKAGR